MPYYILIRILFSIVLAVLAMQNSLHFTCGDPEKFARGDPTLTSFLMRGKRIRIELKAGHHWPVSKMPLNGVSLVGR